VGAITDEGEHLVKLVQEDGDHSKSTYRQSHAATAYTFTSSRHCSSCLNELAVHRHNTPPFTEIVSPPCCGLKVRCDQGVTNGQKDGRCDCKVPGRDEFKQSGGTLRGFHLSIVGTLFHLVQWNKVGATKTVLTKKLKATLSTSCSLNDNVVKHAACRRDSNVVFFCDRCQIS
jgi:hypothetical protein